MTITHLKDAYNAEQLGAALLKKLECRPLDTDGVRDLIARGANTNYCEQNKRTPLTAAAFAGYLDVAHMLLDAGADVNAQESDKMSALHFAVRNDDEAMARLLLARGAKINAAIDGGYTPLHLAANSTNMVIPRLLLDHDAMLHAVADDGATPHDRATIFNRHAICQMLNAEPARRMAESRKKAMQMTAAATAVRLNIPRQGGE